MSLVQAHQFDAHLICQAWRFCVPWGGAGSARRGQYDNEIARAIRVVDKQEKAQSK